MKKFIVGFFVFSAVILFQVNLPAATVEVSVIDFQFQPNPVNINVGDSIVWKNNTALTPHTSTSGTGCSPDGKWNTGTITGGQSSQPIAFNSAGSFPYYCIFHCALFNMKGTVIVGGGTTTTTVPAGECMIMSVKSTVFPLRSGLLPKVRRIVITGMNSNWDRSTAVSIEDIPIVIPLRVQPTKIDALIVIPSTLFGRFTPGEKEVGVATGADLCTGTVEIQ
jgi:plastocyanin